MNFNVELVLIALPVLLLSLTVHEFAHAWMALRQGDDTAYRQGRVNVDPRAHLEPIGSLLFPIIGIGTGMPILGWAKPVPTDPRKYRHYKRGDILVSLAGVMANAVLAVIFALLVLLFVVMTGGMDSRPRFLDTLSQMLVMGVTANVGLILFNLLPIPPLDGSHVFYHLLPPNLGASYRQLQPYGMMILFGLAFFGGFRWMGGIIYAVSNVLLLPTGLVG
jgi:Zn-dependent protease